MLNETSSVIFQTPWYFWRMMESSECVLRNMRCETTFLCTLNCTIILAVLTSCPNSFFFQAQKDICQLFSATSYLDFEVDELSKTFSKTSCQKNAIRDAFTFVSKLIRKMTVFNSIWKWLEKVSDFHEFFPSWTDLYVHRSITVNSSSARISTSLPFFLVRKEAF